MRVVVPYRVADPKTRLADLLDREERPAFARAMLDDVLGAVRAAGHDPTVLATEPFDCPARVRVDDRSLSRAVDAVVDESLPERPVAVVMADLPLATPRALGRLFETDGDVVVAPGRGGGTNALVVRDSAFRADYHGASFRDHRRACETAGLTFETVDSYRLGTDVDEPADLVEVLLHGEGTARRWLDDHAFDVETGDGRVRPVRRERG
ncbi:2-phospho-L-lactate guanylyltransferase [Halomarina litorea]|uniref:2-phospho-L-lactate guanylyltransferase n=1 Tax=Halomarina litorea TaxID=2961595 RepID=UPI0020C3AE47|nr:2-phospho-L-lactate guanylyltransferase [Halomarina sp. BCD28]